MRVGGPSGAPLLPPPDRLGGNLVTDILRLTHLLRRAGLPLGSGSAIDALRAVGAVGVVHKADFYWALHAVYVKRHEQSELFARAFALIWRPLPAESNRSANDVEPNEDSGRKERGERRLAEALESDLGPGGNRREQELPTLLTDAESAENGTSQDLTLMTYSAREVLSSTDFEQMSEAELREAQQAIRRLALAYPKRATRRFRPNPSGYAIDRRRSLLGAVRLGGDPIRLERRSKRRAYPPLIAICDISGSMRQYTRMMLHFMHALVNGRGGAHAFLFGTRLTNATRLLRHADADLALQRLADTVEDWGGGTRIAASVKQFREQWSRRVGASKATLLFITDGLDRDAGDALSREMDSLGKTSRRIVWLNPLLRFEGYEPIAEGARAMIGRVDEFRPVHNLASISALVDSLIAS